MRIRARGGYRIRSIDLKRWDAEVDTLLALYNRCWDRNWGFVPMTEEEFRHSAKDLRMAVDDAWAMLARIAAPDAAHHAMLSCRITVWPERIEVATEVDVDDVADLLPTHSFGWRVLECLTDEVSALVLPGETGQPGRVCLILVKRPVTAHQS